MLCVCKVENMFCKFRYCLAVLCVFLIEVFLSSIWTSFGALTINNFICLSTNNCKYEDNAWLLLFFICLCRFIEIWVELHCRYLHTKSDKYDAIFTHQKSLYCMPVFLIVVQMCSCYLPYGPQFLLFGLCGGILVGIISGHVKYYTKMFHDKDIPERQYDFIIHLGRSTSLMLTSVLLPLAIRHYYGIVTTRLLLSILMGNIIPLAMLIKACRPMKETKHMKIKHNFVQYDSLVYDTSDFEPPVRKIEENSLPSGEEFERDLQAAIDASIKDSLKISDQHSTQACETVNAHENKTTEEKCEIEAHSEIAEKQDLDKIENMEESLETRDITLRRCSWANLGASSDTSSDSLPSNSSAVIYGYHTVQIHDQPSRNRTVSITSTSPSRKCRPAINVQDVCQIQTLPQATPGPTPLPKRTRPSHRRVRKIEFHEFSQNHCRVCSILTSISSYPGIFSALYSNAMCLIYLASFPFMLYRLRLEQENSRTETVEEATFFSLFFLGLCWHAILWFLYYFPKYIFVKYVFGLVLLGSCLLLYFLTDYVDFAGPLFGLGYGITSYLEKDLYAYFTRSDCPEPVVFSFRVTTAFLSLSTCVILPVLARFVTILSVYSAVPFFLLAIGLLAVVKQTVGYDDQQTLLPVNRKRRRNYRTTKTGHNEWSEENDHFGIESVASSDDDANTKTSPKKTWRNWLYNMLISGHILSPQIAFPDVLAHF